MSVHNKPKDEAYEALPTAEEVSVERTAIDRSVLARFTQQQEEDLEPRPEKTLVVPPPAAPAFLAEEADVVLESGSNHHAESTQILPVQALEDEVSLEPDTARSAPSLFEDPDSLGEAFPSSDEEDLAFAADGDFPSDTVPAASGPSRPREPTAVAPSVPIPVPKRSESTAVAAPAPRHEATAAAVAPSRTTPDVALPAALRKTSDSVLSSPAAALVADETTAAIEEAWASVDDQQSGWKNLTGESKVQIAQQGAPTAEVPSSHKSNIFVLGNEIKPQEGARLTVLQGAPAGKVYVLDRNSSIGRSSQCDIAIPDASMSREHARIVREGNQYVLIDNGSANGTFVAQQRVTKATLNHDDIIGFGNVTLHFENPLPITSYPTGQLSVGKSSPKTEPIATADEEAPAAPPASELPANSAKKERFQRQLMLGGGSVLALLLVILIVGLVSRSPKQTGPSDEAFVFYKEGIEAFKARQWDVAETQFEIFLGLAPTQERARRYIEAINQERQNEQFLAAARTDFSLRRLADAYRRVTSMQTVMYENDVEKLLGLIESELTMHLAKAKEALAADRTSEARELLRMVLEVRPDLPGLKMLSDRLEQSEKSRSAAIPVVIPSAGPSVIPSIIGRE